MLGISAVFVIGYGNCWSFLLSVAATDRRFNIAGIGCYLHGFGLVYDVLYGKES